MSCSIIEMVRTWNSSPYCWREGDYRKRRADATKHNAPNLIWSHEYLDQVLDVLFTSGTFRASYHLDGRKEVDSPNTAPQGEGGFVDCSVRAIFTLGSNLGLASINKLFVPVPVVLINKTLHFYWVVLYRLLSSLASWSWQFEMRPYHSTRARSC